jgi:hypothetical protein
MAVEGTSGARPPRRAKWLVVELTRVTWRCGGREKRSVQRSSMAVRRPTIVGNLDRLRRHQGNKREVRLMRINDKDDWTVRLTERQQWRRQWIQSRRIRGFSGDRAWTRGSGEECRWTRRASPGDESVAREREERGAWR